MLLKKAAELAAAESDALGQRLDAGIVERAALDQRQRAGDGVRGAVPDREIGRGLGTAAQAGPESGLLRRRGRGKEARILGPGRARRADRSAIDAGGA